MIEQFYTFINGINPLLVLAVGVVIGIATDEAGRAMLKNFAQDNIDEVTDKIGQECPDEDDP